ncbi:MAG: rhomboid family intramembrane serine protease [Treponema sp.]|jgi:membrane associated rhomboid family serine protease|nr:rhomboid family intramembrane serine protease [Treponema sp.]
MKLKYNAPTVLTFTFISAGVLLISQTLLRFYPLEELWFMAPDKGNFDPGSFRCWLTLFTHIAGHANWTHLVSNFAVILLIGPILEERCGSFRLFVMILVTALVTGLCNIMFFSTTLMGASGVVFMMILLASFTNFTSGEIPLTFVLVLVLYLGREIVNSFASNDISEFAHIVGGFIGSLFGFFMPPGAKKEIGEIPVDYVG